MKKLFSFSIILLLIFNTSCKKEKEVPAEKTVDTKNYIVDTNNSVINWTAYKTTEKIPVKGIFKEVTVTNKTHATNPSEVLNNLEFEIPVASIFSNDSIRDYKLTTFFFGIMKNTMHLKGKISTKADGNGMVNLTMNGLSKDMPFTYEIHGENININAVMNLDNWQAQAAIDALNEVCNDKHKAADGISKTWSEVALNIQIKTKLE
ncbi:MAG: hypothetical protein GQ552_06510 [Flavobacteriaceae bacterium]|nr:hypothetical protein [Flavobacteriaceae bacterium]